MIDDKVLRGNLCLCTNCGQYFRSVSAFDKHQRLEGPRLDRTLVCLNPATVGLVLRDGWWRWPGTDPRRDDESDMPEFGAGEIQGATELSDTRDLTLHLNQTVFAIPLD